VWQSAPDWQTPTTVTEHIRRLRKKIEVDPQRPRLLRTVRGAGYRFDPPIDDSQTLLRQRVADVLGIVVTLEGRVVFADAAAAVLLGVAHEADLLGTEVLDIVAPRSLLAARERMRLTASGGAPRSQVLLVTHQNSTEVPVEVTTTTVEWQGQEAVRIELRHAAVESLRRRHLVTGVLSEVTDAVVVTDMHFHISSWNEAAERLYGWTEDEVLGRHLLDIVEWAGGDELVSAALARLEATGQWHGEGCQHTRDGFEIAVRASTSIVRDDDGLSIGIVSVNRQIDLDHISSPRVPDAEDIADLRRALEQHELTVYYQPVVSLDDQRTITVEALVRWNHPTRGLLDPEAFIETAERSGLILELGSFVLGEACRQVAAWRLEGSDIALAVNLSAMELADRSIVRRITATVAAAGLDLTALWLEVTESALVADVEQASVLLHRLAALGVGIAIDDFGTGWASLTYLRQFPVHVLKIDRSFVSGVDHDSNNAAIVRSILSLGAELGLAVVAEGIETRAEERALQELGCSIGQGFRYGRPTPSHEVDLDRMHRMATRGAGSTDATTGALPINGYPVPRSIDGLREGWEAVFERATSRAAVADGALRIEFGHDMPLVELVQLVEDEQHRTATLSFAITVDHRGVGLELRAPHGAEQVIASLLGSSGDQAGLPSS